MLELRYILKQQLAIKDPLLAGLFLFRDFAFSSPGWPGYASPGLSGAPARTNMAAGDQRALGVIEAMMSARSQCPHAAVRDNAARALEAVKGQGPEVLREQAFLVFSTLAGWRGERADAVKRALRDFLDQSEANRPGT